MTRETQFTVFSEVKGLTWSYGREKGARRVFVCEDGTVYLSGKFDVFRSESAANLAIEIFRMHGYKEKVWRAL